jgi:hypothetical protein
MNEDLLRHLSVPIVRHNPVDLSDVLECRACGGLQAVAYDLALSPPWRPLNGPMEHAAWCIFFAPVLK